MRITGLELKALSESSDWKAARQSLIRSEATAALDLIRKRTGHYPTNDGGNVPVIDDIRSFLAENFPPELGRALIATAPHTHWSELLPIICRFVDGRYIIGTSDIEESGIYLPVSFAFGEKLLPYEWVDQSVIFNETELRACYRVVNILHENFRVHNYIGIGLSYRFRSLFSSRTASTLERDAKEFAGLSEIVLAEEQSVFENEAVEIVAWSLASEIHYSNCEKGLEILRAYRRMSEVNRKKIYDSIILMINQNIL